MSSEHRRRLARITQTLEAHYGTRTPPGGDPVEQLVRTILSQQTTSALCREAWLALRDAYPDWRALRDAPIDEVERVIRPAGLANQKAPRIQQVLEKLEEVFGTVTLDPLDAMNTADAVAFLRRLPGVGPKTAACVLAFSMGRDILPVDTHVGRIVRRVGLVDDSVPKGREHFIVQPFVPKGKSYQLHVDLFELGREKCHSRGPKCDECPIMPMCDTGRGKS